MGKKEELLRQILKGKKGESLKVNFSEIQDFSEVKKIYSNLKGVSKEIPKRIGNLDIKLKNNCYVELDEQLHFNRYRLMTLNSKIYTLFNFFSVNQYKNFCKEHELDCLKSGSYGGKWKNNSTEKLFIPSSSNGILDGNGSSRWRQRAFYDFLKDLIAKERNIVLRRVSIWEEVVNSITVKDILDSELNGYYDTLKEFILNKFDN